MYLFLCFWYFKVLLRELIGESPQFLDAPRLDDTSFDCEASEEGFDVDLVDHEDVS